MSTTFTAPTSPMSSSGIVGQTTRTRVVSIDIFRGFTMAVMIFVNDTGEVGGLSRWMHHFPRDVDAMSFVDMVYPFFLFAVGLALPIAVRQRLARDPSQPRLWGHILLRCFALLVLGLILANAQGISVAAAHMHGSLWALIGLLGAILLWLVYPPATPRTVSLALKVLGAITLVAIYAIYRRDLPGGHLGWIDFSYPEILGLISLTYLAVCILYIPTRRFTWAPAAWCILLLLYNCLACSHYLNVVNQIPMYILPWNNGAMPAISMAGVVVSGIFVNDRLRSNPRRQITLGIVITVVALVAGLLTRPLGISKIRATPTWSLWSIAGAAAMFTLFYVVCDLRKRTVWAAPFRAPGANTLLTYLLPDLTYFLLAFLHLNFIFAHWSYGLPGLLRGFVFTGVMLLFSFLLTRAKLRMQL